VLRISPAGEGFVLYEMGKREITAVAVANDGSVYAAGVGSKQAAAPIAPPPPPPPAPVPAAQAGIAVIPHTAVPPPSFGPAGGVAISGGSDLYHIHPDGYPEKIWSHTHDIVYSIGFGAGGRPLVSTGNKGIIYRIDSDALFQSGYFNDYPYVSTPWETGTGDAKLGLKIKLLAACNSGASVSRKRSVSGVSAAPAA